MKRRTRSSARRIFLFSLLIAVPLGAAVSLGGPAPASAQLLPGTIIRYIPPVTRWVPSGCAQPSTANDCTGNHPQFEQCIVPQLFRADSACTSLLGITNTSARAYCPALSPAECRRLATSDSSTAYCRADQFAGARTSCTTYLSAASQYESRSMSRAPRMEPRSVYDESAAPVSWVPVTGTDSTVVLPAQPPRSRYSFVDYARYRSLMTNERSFWLPASDEANFGPDGVGVGSCQEYVYESFYDLARFEDAARGEHDPRRVWDVAFGDPSLPSSIGSRHRSDETLRRRSAPGESQGIAFGRMWPAGTTQPRNAFYALDDVFAIDALASLLGTSTAVQNYRRGYSTNGVDVAPNGRITPSFEWYAQARDRLTHPWWGARREAPVTSATHYTGYSDEELEYLWDLQQRFRAMLDQMNELPLALCVESAAPTSDIFEDEQALRQAITEYANRVRSDGPEWGGGGPVITTATQALAIRDLAITGYQSDSFTRASSLISSSTLTIAPTVLDGPVITTYFDDIATDVPDLGSYDVAFSYSTAGCDPAVVAQVRAERERFYAEMRALIEEANRWGCFRTDGLGPCDFSYSRFASEIRDGRFAAQQEGEYGRCNGYFADEHNPWNLPDSDTFEWPGDLNGDGATNDLDCGGTTATTTLVRAPTTVSGIRGSVDAVRWFFLVRDAEQRYRDHCQTQNARREIASTAPELVGSDGELLPPGFQANSGEMIGDAGLFGLSYAYDVGFGVGGWDGGRANESPCTAPLTGHGSFNADAYLYNVHVPLIAGRADQVAGTVTLDVLGRNIYTARAGSGSHVSHAAPGATVSATAAAGVIVVLGVPISFRAGGAGTVAVEASAHTVQAGDSIACGIRSAGVTFRPSVRVDGFVTAAVDVGIARAGVKGRLTIIDASVPFEVSTEITPGDDSRLTVVGTGDLQLRTLSGRVSAFAEIGISPLSTSAETTIFEWTGPSWNTELFRHEYTLRWNLLQRAF